MHYYKLTRIVSIFRGNFTVRYLKGKEYVKRNVTIDCAVNFLKIGGLKRNS